MAEQGYCDRPSVAYVFGSRGRTTVVVGHRATELSEQFPDNARCAEHALDAVEKVMEIALARTPKSA